MTTPPMPLVQVFTPDGHLADIPYDRLHDALGQGAKIAAKVKAPDGTVGFVPGDRVPDALKAGGQRVPLDGNDADGGNPGFWSRALGLKQGATSDQFLDQMGQSNIAAAKFGADTMAGTTLAGPAAKLFNTEALPALKAVPFLGKAVSAIDEAPGVIGKVVRGATVGGTSGGVEAAIRGKNPGEIAKEAGYGALTGGALGAAIPLAERLAPPPGEYPGASLPATEDFYENRGAEMNKARAMQDIQMRREATAKATADRAAAKADDAARQPVPLTSSPNYPKWQADQAAAAQAAKDAARADAAARQPVPVSQSPYYAQNQAAQAAEEAARKPVPLNQSPYYTQNQAAAAPAQPLGSVYGPPTPTPEQLAQQGVKLSDLATPQAPPLTSEGRPATWTNDTVRKLAAWGDPDAVDQARARGFGTIQKNYSLADLNPRSVTRFSPEGVPLSDLLNSPGNQTLNPVGAGGARPIVSPANQFESSFGPEHQEVGDLAEWETGNRQGVKVGSDLDQAAKSMFGGKSFDTLTPEQKAHILRIAQTQVAVP